jgi:hypothetical protein
MTTSAATLAADRVKIKMGAGAALPAAVDDGAGDLGPPRTIGCYRSPQHTIRKLMMLSPLPNGRRSMNDGEARRRRSQAHGAAMIWSIIELAGGTSGTSSSPGTQRAWRRGLGWSQSTAMTVTGVGEDGVGVVAPEVLSPIPRMAWARSGWRWRWSLRRGSGVLLSMARRIGRLS